MGIGDLFGLRAETVVVKKGYKTIYEIYEDIKDVPFEAGKPVVASVAMGDVIVFPKLNDKNQVQIFYAGKKRIIVQRSRQAANIGNIIEGDVMSNVTSLSDVSQVLGNPKRRCMDLTTTTARQLRALNL